MHFKVSYFKHSSVCPFIVKWWVSIDSPEEQNVCKLMRKIIERKTPRGCIQIGEPRWEMVRESHEGFSPSGILRTLRVSDLPM